MCAAIELPTLDLATNEELLQELLSRHTFAGVIVYSPDNQRFSGQVHKEFRVTSTCDDPSTIRLLEQAIKGVKKGNK